MNVVTSETVVTLFDVDQKTFEETKEWSGTLAQFIADNEFEADELAVLNHHLTAFGYHAAGGGAFALTVLRITGCLQCGKPDSDAVHDPDAAANGQLPKGAYHRFAAAISLTCRYCKSRMDRRITRNPFNGHEAPGDVCGDCLRDDAIDYAGVSASAFTRAGRASV